MKITFILKNLPETYIFQNMELERKKIKNKSNNNNNNF